MQVFVYSRQALDAARPHEVPHVIVSITSSADDVAKLRSNAMCRGVLRLAFPDVEEPSVSFAESILFSPAHAAQITDFVREHAPHVERILVHCDAGVSRSAAVGAAIARALNGDDTEFFAGRYRPNMRVYRMVLASFDVKPAPGEGALKADSR
jgi:predicted protein tyrosine phosphatase